MRVTIPYGSDSLAFDIDDKRFVGMLDATGAAAVDDPVAEIERALEAPIGCAPIEDIVKPASRVAIIVDDGSRPTPVKLILPALIAKLERAGARRENVFIVVALGSHRYMSEDELRERVGGEVYAKHRVINSEFRAPERLVYAGDTPEGAPIMVTKEVMEADVRIGVGNLAPHPVMGWGGGGKILYPGVTGERTVAYFHLKASLIDENMFGLRTTPIRDMMEGWVGAIGLDFIVNTVLTPNFRLYRVVAGHYIAAHRAGVELAKKCMGCRVSEKTDVVVVSAHPADQDFWQSPKGMYAAERALKGERGGTMILVSPNYEGIGPHVEYPYYMGRDDGDEAVASYLRGGQLSGDPLAIAVGNSMSKLKRRRRLVVVSDGVTDDEMAACGVTRYPASELQRAVDDSLALYAEARLAAMSHGAETFLYE